MSGIAGKKFALKGLLARNHAVVKNLINEHGGQVVKLSKADYVIVPDIFDVGALLKNPACHAEVKTLSYLDAATSNSNHRSGLAIAVDGSRQLRLQHQHSDSETYQSSEPMMDSGPDHMNPVNPLRLQVVTMSMMTPVSTMFSSLSCTLSKETLTKYPVLTNNGVCVVNNCGGLIGDHSSEVLPPKKNSHVDHIGTSHAPLHDLHRSFVNPFHGTEAVAALDLHFSKCIALLNQTVDLYLPYISVVQSSGTGKSRLMFEYSQQHQIPLYYACFRLVDPTDTAIGRSGFPLASQFQEQIKHSLRNIDSALIFLRSLISQIEFLNSNSAEKSRFFDKVSLNQSSSKFAQLFNSFWREVLVGDQAGTQSKDSSKFLPAHFDRVQHLVVFDEARGLLSLPTREACSELEIRPFFIYLRQAITQFTRELKELGVMFVFIDTTSKVANFSPSRAHGSDSVRRGDFKLLPPFHNIANAPNLYWRTFDNATRPPVDDSNVFLFGRPLWWTTYKANTSFSVLLDFAKEKLLAKYTNDHWNAASAAVICCLLDLPIMPGSQLSVSLISSHMAICVGISDNREYSRCVYLNEPILHAAALALLHEHTEVILGFARQHFARADLGWSGEFAAQIVCLLAATKPEFAVKLKSTDGLSDASQFNQSLTSFLLKLLSGSRIFDELVACGVDGKSFKVNFKVDSSNSKSGKSNQSSKVNPSIKKQIDKYLPGAVIRLLRFVRLPRAPLWADLPLYFTFGIGFVCPRNNESADLCFVVRYPSRVSHNVFEYTVAILQIKNEACEFSSHHCINLVRDIQLIHTFQPEVSAPAMPFGPTSRTFADEKYSLNDPRELVTKNHIRILMKMRESVSEYENGRDVYIPFCGMDRSPGPHHQPNYFFGVTRGFENFQFLSGPIKQLLFAIVADNERFFIHEMPEDPMFVSFRASYDLLAANQIVNYDMQSQSKSALISAICKSTSVGDPMRLISRNLMSAYQLYRSRQLNSIIDRSTSNQSYTWDILGLLNLLHREVNHPFGVSWSAKSSTSQQKMELLEKYFRDLEHGDGLGCETQVILSEPEDVDDNPLPKRRKLTLSHQNVSVDSVSVPPTKPIGLANCGNSCYQNAFLQALYHTLDFKRLICSMRFVELDPILAAKGAAFQFVLAVFLKLDQCGEIFFQPFMSWAQYDGLTEQDTVEFGLDILESVRLVCEHAFVGESANDRNELEKCFGGAEESTLLMPDNFLDLQLVFRQDDFTTDNKPISISSMVSRRFDEFKLVLAPLNLIVTLKRFEFEHGQSSRISIPVMLDSVLTISLDDDTVYTYALYAVIVHSSSLMNRDHYYAHVLNSAMLTSFDSNQFVDSNSLLLRSDIEHATWFLCDDKNVSESEFQDFADMRGDDVPYVLFYRLMNR